MAFACTDATIPIALRCEPGQPAWRWCLPPADAYFELSDKWRLYQLAGRLGIAVPETLLVPGGSGRGRLPDRLSGPAIVKPRQSVMQVGGVRLKLPVRRAADRSSLDLLLTTTYPEDAELLVQQAVSGASFGVSAVCNHGRPIAWFAHKRIREMPPSGGVSTLCESVPLHPHHRDSCTQLIEHTNWHGPIMFEFMGTPEGQAWLIEVNARLWGSVQLAIDCGVDVPWLMYQLATGAPPEPVGAYAVGRQLRWFMGDMSHLYLVLRNPRGPNRRTGRLKTLADVLFKWNSNQRTEDWRYRDFGPFWHQLRQEALSALGPRSGP